MFEFIKRLMEFIKPCQHRYRAIMIDHINKICTQKCDICGKIYLDHNINIK